MIAVHVIRMPDIGEGIAEVELVAWHVAPGDIVREDQVLADVMTDKATVELPAPSAGTVLEIHGNPGERRPVGSELVVLDVAGAGNVAAAAKSAAPPHPRPSPPPLAGEWISVTKESFPSQAEEGNAVTEEPPPPQAAEGRVGALPRGSR